MKIGIVVAMRSELEPFLRGKEVRVEKKGMFEVYVAFRGKDQLCAVLPANIGEICAAAATQLLATAYGVDVIVNFGVVGALKEEVGLMDAVLVESVVHYDMDVSALDGRPVGKYRFFDDVAFSTDARLLAEARKIVPNMPVVRCASADKFVADPAAKSALAANFSADICDMESAGILIAAKLNDLPVFMVKVVSDSLTGGAEEFETCVEKAAERFATLVDELLERMKK